MKLGLIWTVQVAEIGDLGTMRGTEYPTFAILGSYRCITEGKEAAYTAAEICSGVWSLPGVYRVMVTAPEGYTLEETGTWTVTVAASGKPEETAIKRVA